MFRLSRYRYFPLSKSQCHDTLIYDSMLHFIASFWMLYTFDVITVVSIPCLLGGNPLLGCVRIVSWISTRGGQLSQKRWCTERMVVIIVIWELKEFNHIQIYFIVFIMNWIWWLRSVLRFTWLCFYVVYGSCRRQPNNPKTKTRN